MSRATTKATQEVRVETTTSYRVTVNRADVLRALAAIGIQIPADAQVTLQGTDDELDEEHALEAHWITREVKQS